MITQSQIHHFFSGGPIAVAGVSRNPLKFGYLAFKTLAGTGNRHLLPVNPSTDRIFNRECYRNIASLPSGIHAVVLFTHPEETLSMVLQAMKKGIRNIWVQRGSETPDVLKLAETPGFNIIHGKCVIMFNNRMSQKSQEQVLPGLNRHVISENVPVYN